MFNVFIFPLAVLIFLALSFLALLWVEKNIGKETELFPFYPSYLMTKREQQLYWRLVETLPDCVIMSQVSMMGILNVKKGYRDFYKYVNKVNRLRLDFVICRKDTYPLAVIELDDSSHDNARQQARDAKKDKALKDAGIKIIRWRGIPSAETIKFVLQGLI